MAVNNALNLNGTGIVTSDGDGTFTYNTVTEGGVLLAGASNTISSTGILPKGTVLVGDGTTAPTELAVGTNDQVLTADSAEASGVKWAASSGGGTWVWLNSQTASSSATIEWDSTYITTTYEIYIISIRDVLPATDNTLLYMRVSDDNGSTFKSGGTDYEWNLFGQNSGSGVGTGDTSDSEIQLSGTIGQGNVSDEIGDYLIYLFMPTSSATNTTMFATGDLRNTSDAPVSVASRGRYNTTADTDAIQFLYSSGNIAQGEFVIYGLKES